MGTARGLAAAYPPGQYQEFLDRVLAEINYMHCLLMRQPRLPYTFGEETEIVIVDLADQPLRIAPYVVQQGRARGHDLVHELMAYQTESRGLVLPFSKTMFTDYMDSVDVVLRAVEDIVRPLGGRPGLVGILPTVKLEDLRATSMTPGNPRFPALSHHLQDQLGPISVKMGGLNLTTDEFCLAGATTSLQTHRTVHADELVDMINAAQMAQALIVASTAGSPVFLGKRVGAEGRIPLFTRVFRDLPTLGPCLKLPDGGTTWVQTIRQVLEYCLRFPVVMPELSDTPVSEAWHWRFLFGLIHPWVCPTFYTATGQFGIESRAKPAGPCIIDQAMDHALDLALTAAIARRIRSWIAAGYQYHHAIRNFESAATHGLAALVYWPDKDGRPEIALARDIALDLLRDDAIVALADLGVGMDTARHILALARARVSSGKTAAHWITQAVINAPGESVEHNMALVTHLYLNTSANGRAKRRPVHEWEPPTAALLAA
jgi:hypothetical protein